MSRKPRKRSRATRDGERGGGRLLTRERVPAHQIEVLGEAIAGEATHASSRQILEERRDPPQVRAQVGAAVRTALFGAVEDEDQERPQPREDGARQRAPAHQLDVRHRIGELALPRDMKCVQLDQNS